MNKYYYQILRFLLIINLFPDILCYSAQSDSRSLPHCVVDANISEKDQNTFSQSLSNDPTIIAEKSIISCHTAFGIYALDGKNVPFVIELGGMYKYLLNKSSAASIYGQIAGGVSYEPYIFLELNLNVSHIFNSNVFGSVGIGFRNKLGNGARKYYDQSLNGYSAYFIREGDIYLPIEIGIEFSWCHIGLLGRIDIKPSAEELINKRLNADEWYYESNKIRVFSVSVRFGIKL